MSTELIVRVNVRTTTTTTTTTTNALLAHRTMLEILLHGLPRVATLSPAYGVFGLTALYLDTVNGFKHVLSTKQL